MKTIEEQTMRTIVLAAAGLAVLLVFAPEWARTEVLVFAALIAMLAYAVDGNVRDVVRRILDSGLRRNDARKARAKSPASRRAAT